MGATCCQRNETSGNVLEGDNISINKLGFNTSQKLAELRAYRFFLNSLHNKMMINDNVSEEEFYFIKKAWLKSWYKYTCYDELKPLLKENEINNEIDFKKLIIDRRKELNFQGFIEKIKPEKMEFFEINNNNTNIQHNFYIFNQSILNKFKDIYGTIYDINTYKEAICLKGEIGKGRIIFDVTEYILIMLLNQDLIIKQIVIIFGNTDDHKNFLKSIYGRGITHIFKELKKINEKNQMLNYEKEEIKIYDDREFIKDSFKNTHKL